MKKTTLTNLFAIATVMVIASCTKEVSNNIPKEPQGKIFTAQFEVVKTTLDDTHTPAWVEGDAIGVTSANDNNVECVLLDASKGIFSADNIEGSAPFWAVYPYSENNTFSGDVLTAVLPAEQKLVEGSPVAPGALVAACKSNSSTLSFKNCVSLLQITIPVADVKKVEISAPADNEYLAGKFTMDLSEDTLAPTLDASEPSKSVVLLPAGEAFVAGTYYVAVAPVTLSSLKIEFTNAKDEKVSVTKTKAMTFARSAGSNLGSFFVYDLETADDLIKWAKQTAKSTPWDVVTLKNDIVLDDTQAAEYVEAHNFCGTFDGGNHKISGLTCPLFGDMQGIVKNLEVEATIEFDGAESSQIKGKVNGMGILAQYLKHELNSAAKVENVTASGSITITDNAISHAQYVGGICGGTNGVPVTGCTNNAAITVNGQITGKLLVGGIVGVCQTDVKGNLEDCTNAGAVTISSTASSTDILTVGGIAGNVLRAITVDNCDNSGEITNSAASATTFYTGGIVGFWDVASQGTKTATISNCDNTGKVTDDSQYATAVDHITAGVVASINASDPVIGEEGVTESKINVKNCSNDKVAITNSASQTKNCYNGGIVGLLSHYGVIEGCINKSAGVDYDRVVVKATTASEKIAIGGVVGIFNKNAYIHNCQNQGRVYLVSGVSCNTVRMGGIAGSANHAELIAGKALVTYENCKNYGTVLHAAAGCSEKSHVGGILGSAAGGKAITIKNCVNKVKESQGIRIANNPSGSKTTMCMGGIIGYTYYPDRLEGCKHFGEVSRAGANIARCGGFFGSNGGQSTKIFIGNDCRIGGKVRGTAITSGNAQSYFGYDSWTNIGSKMETDLTSADAYWDGTE